MGVKVELYKATAAEPRQAEAMSDLLFDLWWRMRTDGTDPEVRRRVCRAMLLCGTSGRYFEAFDGPVRIGHRRWDIR